jgi:hypothetical protein
LVQVVGRAERRDLVEVVLISLISNNVNNLVEGDLGVVLLVCICVISQNSIIRNLLKVNVWKNFTVNHVRHRFAERLSMISFSTTYRLLERLLATKILYLSAFTTLQVTESCETNVLREC